MTFREMLVQMIHQDLGFGFYELDGVRDCKFEVVTKTPGIICGTIFIPTIVDIVEKEFFLKSAYNRGDLTTWPGRVDGDLVQPNEIVYILDGNAEVLLKAERTICNILSNNIE